MYPVLTTGLPGNSLFISEKGFDIHSNWNVSSRNQSLANISLSRPLALPYSVTSQSLQPCWAPWPVFPAICFTLPAVLCPLSLPPYSTHQLLSLDLSNCLFTLCQLLKTRAVTPAKPADLGHSSPLSSSSINFFLLFYTKPLSLDPSQTSALCRVKWYCHWFRNQGHACCGHSAKLPSTSTFCSGLLSSLHSYFRERGCFSSRCPLKLDQLCTNSL